MFFFFLYSIKCFGFFSGLFLHFLFLKVIIFAFQELIAKNFKASVLTWVLCPHASSDYVSCCRRTQVTAVYSKQGNALVIESEGKHAENANGLKYRTAAM